MNPVVKTKLKLPGELGDHGDGVVLHYYTAHPPAPMSRQISRPPRCQGPIDQDKEIS